MHTDAALWREFAAQVYYHAGDIEKAEDFVGLNAFLKEIEGGAAASRVFYLATAPRFFRPPSRTWGRRAWPTNRRQPAAW